MKFFILAGASLAALSLAPLPFNSAAEAQIEQALQIDRDRGVLTLAPLLEAVTPAVVNIATIGEARSRNNPMMNDPLFRRFFGNEDNPNQPQRRSGAAGSGVIVDAGDGIIITNHHVIKGADEIIVTLKDKRRFDAELVGSDAATDIAVLRIDGRNLDALKIQTTDDSKVGDYVIAIGNPFGLEQTVTTGIVSALDRDRGISSRDSYTNFIQTDAAINPGNSGGALINTKGELIGINTAILSRNGGSNGIGFAVPADMVISVKNQLLKYGEVRRGRIGVVIQDVTPDLADAFDLNLTSGALVAQVTEDSPAQDAGLEEGDVIIAFNGQEITGAASIRNAVGLTERGKRVNMTYVRDGRERNTTIRVEAAPDDEREGITSAGDVEADEKVAFKPMNFRGAEVENIPDDMEIAGGNKGVLVTSVEPYSKAYRAGLVKGDVIRKVKDTKIIDLANFEKAIKDKEGILALTVDRGRRQLFLAVR